MPRKRKLSIFFWLISLFVILGIAGVLGCNLWVIKSGEGRVYRQVSGVLGAEEAPGEKWPVGMVLGTSKKVDVNTPNPYFENRLEAASQLLKSGAVEKLLVSGHRDSKYYDETRDMIIQLIKLGVPEDKIVSDDRGARTLVSVSRAKVAYGFANLVIVTDDFHVSRALFIADRFGINAVALESERVNTSYSRGVRAREFLARVKAVIDLYWLELSGMEEELAGFEACAPKS